MQKYLLKGFRGLSSSLYFSDLNSMQSDVRFIKTQGMLNGESSELVSEFCLGLANEDTLLAIDQRIDYVITTNCFMSFFDGHFKITFPGFDMIWSIHGTKSLPNHQCQHELFTLFHLLSIAELKAVTLC